MASSRALALGVLIACASAGATAASAQPSILGTTGTIAQGATITITGNGFDTKIAEAPLKWDDFQSVAIGEEIVTSAAPGPPWRNNGDARGNDFNPIASSRYLRANTPFTRHMESHWRQPEGGLNTASNVALVGQNLRKFFLDAWLYNDTVGLKPNSTCCNVKHVRLHQDGASGDAPNLGITDEGPFRGQLYATAGDNRAQPHSNGSDYATQAELYNQWVHLQWLLDPNGGASLRRGRVRVYVNGQLRVSSDADNLVNTGYLGWTELYLGNYWRSDDFKGDVYAYWDSVFVDHGWNRVELSNSKNYAKASHREIQPWRSWTPGRVTIVGNRGSFQPGDEVYLCLVNNNNQADCDGPHLLGPDQPSATPPAAASKRPPANAAFASSDDSSWLAGLATATLAGAIGGLVLAARATRQRVERAVIVQKTAPKRVRQ